MMAMNIVTIKSEPAVSHTRLVKNRKFVIDHGTCNSARRNGSRHAI